jgi:cytochrome P450
MFDASFFIDPYPLYARLRAAAAIHFAPGTGKHGGWLVPRYDDACTVLGDASLSSARSGLSFAGYPPQERTQLQKIQDIFAQSMMFLDPPMHTQWRRIVLKAFTRARIDELRPVTRRIAQQLLDKAAAEGRFDFVADYANLLPIHVVAHLLGADVQDHRQFTVWARRISTFVSVLGPSMEVAQAAQEATLALYRHAQGVIAARERSPREDAISEMIREVDLLGLDAQARERAVHEELPAHCVGLMVAGHETSANLIGNAMNTIFREPWLHELLVATPALAHEAADEFARFDASAQIIVRVTARPCELLGRQLEPGQVVMALVGSANRDESKFEHPDEFQINRGGERSLTFGNGRHYCPGAQMGLMELAIAIEEVLQRFPKLRLDVPVQALRWRPSVNFRGLIEMPVAVQ